VKSFSETVFISIQVVNTTRYRPSTIVEVARQAGVSPATVSRVLNGSAVVVPETAQRVRMAIADLNFSPHPAARQLLKQRTNAIGLLLPEISGEFFPPMLRGIEAGVRQAGYDLLIHSTLDGHRCRPLTEHNTDGLIVFPGSVDDAELRRLFQIGFPVVLLHRSAPEGAGFPCVTVENKAGAEMLVNHLIERHGRRRIVYLQGPQGNEDSAWRERGYRQALTTHDLPFDPALVASGGFDEKESFAAIQEILLAGVEFDAVFTGDDDAALGVMRALKLAGRTVPHDVSVVGFDDIPFARYMSPALTTVHAPIEEVGREAVRQLVRLIDGKPSEVLILMHSELIIRQSCGCRGDS
jgi:DNA-binding LacI/PurR family transcriptional regulator